MQILHDAIDAGRLYGYWTTSWSSYRGRMELWIRIEDQKSASLTTVITIENASLKASPQVMYTIASPYKPIF